jgi:hypothetical protein
MQIREQGNQIQLIRTHYNKTKQRTLGKVFAKFNKLLTKAPDDVIQQLVGDEVVQLQTYLSTREASDNLVSAKYHLRYAAAQIKRATDSLYMPAALIDTNGVDKYFSQVDADSIYEAMAALKKALKKSGFSETPAKNRVQISPEKTTEDLFDSLTEKPNIELDK